MNLTLLNHLISESSDKQTVHKHQLIKHLFNLSAASVSTLCEVMDMSTPSILKLLTALIEEEWVEKKGFGVSIGGRKPDLYRLKDKKILILCIDIELFHTKIAIIDNNYNLVTEVKTFLLPISKSRTDFFQILNTELQDFLKSSAIDHKQLIGCSVGMPGLIDAEKG